MVLLMNVGVLALKSYAILPNHWHTTPPHTGKNSAKSMAHSSTAYRQFCKITSVGNSAKSLAHSSKYRQFCQITGTLIHIQAILSNHWHKQFCKTIGTLFHIQSILPNHWHSTVHIQAITITARQRQTNCQRTTLAESSKPTCKDSLTKSMARSST